MDANRITAVLYLHKKNQKVDVDVPLDITANELIQALNTAFRLGIDMNDPVRRPHLKAENPIALLTGGKLLSEYRLRNGTIIHHTE